MTASASSPASVPVATPLPAAKPPAPALQAVTEQPDKAPVRDNDPQAIMAETAIWMVVVAILTFVATTVGTFAIWRQTKLTRRAVEEATAGTAASREANEIARENSRRELRPYLYPSHAHLSVDATHNVVAHLTISNFGQTPALDNQSWIHTWVECFPLHDPLPTPPHNLMMSKSVVGPGAASEFQHEHPRPLNDHSLQEIEAGRAAFYVYGEVRYRDVFGREHWSKYVYFASGPGSVQLGRLSPYTSGNGIDIEP